MPKRKFSDLNDRPSGAVDIKLARLTAKFENGVTALSRALKTARAFERQKLGRREKTAKSENKPEALARIEEEIRVIKSLNFQATAEKYLFKQLVKTKRIAESPVFLKFKERKIISTEGPRSTAEANVTARLYKSNPVKNVFPGIMDGIRQLLGLEAAAAGKKNVSEQKKGSTDQRKSESKEPSLDGGSELEEESDADSRKTASKAAARSAKVASEEADREEGSDVDMDDAESVDYSHFDARLASDSGSHSDGESDAEEASDSDNSNISRSISRSPSPEKPTKKSKKATSTPATSTTFLPSLTMGGYFSGSESEPEDLEGTAGPPRRKNRMGQQARRALWEKKYGSGANHIKKQKENEWKNRDSGWDARRGATDGTEGPRGKRGLGQGRPWQRNNNSTGGDRPQRGPPGGSNKKNVKDDKPLHPSWEAARKAKEQKSMAAFQGKKVTFD
ncbi:hypothetical protein KXW75_004134 [Aspergillus fumigatus]|uniref:Bud22 domain-containing protein n=1 Tax=Aspergillus fumigatus TaxID=746128 RepID=A0A9P8SR20_ASPFM|nr:hypothetical protein KXX20_002600 [Aspergillus fumigatus]KAH1824579.1 hypothetical protein KXX35_009018 [Aspergillus fumigatus]KAH1896058.1 hypothetical protein KXV57_001505 [Aspergillus fumigatus]KAH2117836.1 hypothetical protein KXW75_004134 [Aspergillus fumigatus]KAH2271910.1 hypothetical protein KXW02_001151 [Aspergillus fumigatus]